MYKICSGNFDLFSFVVNLIKIFFVFTFLVLCNYCHALKYIPCWLNIDLYFLFCIVADLEKSHHQRVSELQRLRSMYVPLLYKCSACLLLRMCQKQGLDFFSWTLYIARYVLLLCGFLLHLSLCACVSNVYFSWFTGTPIV